MNINYPDSNDYTNLAKLWLQAATDKDQKNLNETDQKIATRHVLDKTSELTDRIKNIDGGIAHEEVSHICDRILGEFNRLSPANQDTIARYVATIGDTGYDRLHKLFQTIGDTQHLPNYFDPPASSTTSLDVVSDKLISIFSFFTKQPPSAEGIRDLGIKVKDSVALTKPTLLKVFQDEKGLQNQILSYVDKPSRIAAKSVSKKGLVEFNERVLFEIMNGFNSSRIETIMKELKIKSFDQLISYLGPLNCMKIKRLETNIFSSDALGGKSAAFDGKVDTIQKAFPNLKGLTIHEFQGNVLEGQKNSKSIEILSLCGFDSQLLELDIKSLVHLSELYILAFDKLKTINTQDLTSLSRLTMQLCPNLDMSFTKNIPSLKKLHLTAPTDSNLAGLAGNSYITDIFIDAVYSFKNFDFLLKMPALKNLAATGTGRIGHLPYSVPNEIENELRRRGVKIETS